MSAGEKLCTCGHHKHHHIQAVALDADGNEAIGSLVQCFGLGRENGCPCSHYVTAGYVEQFVSPEEVAAAIRTLHAHASITGARLVLVTHAGATAKLYTNAPTPDAALSFLGRCIDVVDDNGGDMTTESPPLQRSRTDPRRFVLLPRLITLEWQQFEEQIGGLDDDDDDDDGAEEESEHP